MKFTSLKWKLVSIMLLITILPTVALGSIIYAMTSNAMQSRINNDFEQTITQVNEAYDSFFEKISASVQYAASSRYVKEAYKSIEDEQEMMKEFVDYVGVYPDVQHVYLGMEDGRMLVYPDLEFPEGYDPKQSGWYISAKENQEKLYWTEPYVDASTGEYVVSAAIEIKDAEGNFAGVLGVDVNLQELTELMSGIKIGEGGFAFAADRKGITIAHADKERVGKGIGDYDWGKEILSNTSGSLEYSIENVKRYVVYQTNKTTGWKIAGVIGKRELTSELNRIKYVSFALCVIGILFALIGSFYAGSIVSPIKKLAQILGRLSKYDLTIDENSDAIKYLKRKDEIGEITNALTAMQSNIITLVKSIADRAQQVASSSVALSETSQQSAAATDEVARAIEEIAKGADDQAKNTEDGVVQISELGQLIEEEQKRVNDLNNAANEVGVLKDEGLEGLKDLVEKTDLSSKAAKDALEIIVNTNESAKKIENASQMIKGIAEQTNLLALNAAIEAARAGETGRGFAVVAEEIRRLSEQSNSFTVEISEVIRELSEKTQYALQTMQETGKIVVSQAKSVEESNDKFVGIAAAIEKMKSVIAKINQSGYEMSNKKDQIIGIIENLSAISEENAAGTQEASASIEEQTSSMAEIANASESLSRLAEEMQGSISSFKY